MNTKHTYSIEVHSTGEADIPVDHYNKEKFRTVFIIHYVTKGCGYLETEGKTYRIEKGQSFIIYPGIVISYYPDPDDPWSYIWVDFNGSEIERLLGYTAFSVKNPVLPAIDESPYEILKSIHRAHRDKVNSSAVKWCAENGYLHLLLAFYAEHYPSVSSPSNDEQLVNRAIKYIELNLHHHDLTARRVADYLGISHGHLCRIFEAKFGISPLKHINFWRLQKAVSILENYDHPIKTVAYSLGFSDPLYFSKLFKKHLGYSPADYRKKRRAGIISRSSELWRDIFKNHIE